MANMYFIDYENVGDAAVIGAKTLVPGERIAIFFSKNAKSLTFELWNELVDCKATKEVKMVEHPGKNALDFQLSSYLGYSICKYLQIENFVIISKDTGFQTLIEFWEKERGVKTHLFSTMEEALEALTKVEESGESDSEENDD